MKNLFICNTPYQIMVANSIAEKIFSDHENCFLCSTIMSNAKDVVKNLNVFYKSFLFNIDKRKHGRLHRVVKRLFYRNSFKNYDIDKNFVSYYDNIFISNLTNEHFIILKNLKRINKNIKVNMFEDGVSTYTKLCEKTFFDSRIKWSKIINHVYVFKPCEFEWKRKEKIKCITIPPFECENNKYVSKINTIFNYSKIDNYENYEFIFFEEGFYADGNDIKDLELVDEISKIVGKNNMFIKTHPRSPNNRFIECGYNTNLNSSIPWEVICLNTDLSKTVLITLSSQSVFTPMFLLNKKTTSIIMFNMLNDKSMIYMDSALFIEEKGKQFDTFFNFNSIEQLKKKLKEIKGEIT